jgi:putative transposase
MKFRAIDAQKVSIPVRRSCAILDVNESGFSTWQGRKPSQRQRDDMVLLAHVRSQFFTSHETYGSPRMTVELTEADVSIGRHRGARLMRENRLKAFQKRRFKRTTDSAHGGLIASNMLDHDFETTGPNQKWGVDISYI